MPQLPFFLLMTMEPLPEPAAALRALVDLDRTFWWMVVLAGVLVLWFAGLLFYNRGRVELPLPPPAPPPRKPRGFGDQVAALREETERSGEYRRGCHALARQVREELQSRLGAGSRSLAMTAAEIAKLSPNPDVDALVERLREVRFARQHPKRPQFVELCRDAVRTFEPGSED